MKINFQNNCIAPCVDFVRNVSPAVSFCASSNISGTPKDVFVSTFSDREKADIPIKDDNEFNFVFSRVLHEIGRNGQSIWITYNDWEEYKNINPIEKGLLIYCGHGGGYRTINMFLSGRLTPENKEKYAPVMPLNEKSTIDAVRALEYSLNHLDKKYGKYEGIVFRQGFMDEQPGQYVSTSTSSFLAAAYNNIFLDFNPENKFSVIRTKNGHKINEFQREINSQFAHKEEEILLPYQNKYKKLKEEELDEELIKAKNDMALNLFRCANGILADVKDENVKYHIEDIIKMIDVYEEVD